MDHTTMNPKYLDSLCQELFNGGLGIVATLLVRWGTDFVCVFTGGPIQLYVYVITFSGLCTCEHVRYAIVLVCSLQYSHIPFQSILTYLSKLRIFVLEKEFAASSFERKKITRDHVKRRISREIEAMKFTGSVHDP